VIGILLKALLAAALFVCVLTASRFWAAAASSLHLEHIRRRSGNRIWLWVLSEAVTCLAALLVSAFLYPAFLFTRHWLPEPRPGAPGPPVLFVHGLFHTASAWLSFARWFRRAERQSLYVWTYASFSTDFDCLLERLEARVREVQERHPGHKVVLVGHSLGGLLIRALLNRPEARDLAACAVTLGAPHQGSVLAGLGFSALARSLAYRGPLIKRIEAAQAPPPVPALSIYSPVDNMVIPPEGTRIRVPGWLELETQPVSHVWLLYHRPTAEAALSFIAAALRGEAMDSAADR
jgi:triacylglycerol esterase/lipase EstA (alpha/beta hydrolase family)